MCFEGDFERGAAEDVGGKQGRRGIGIDMPEAMGGACLPSNMMTPRALRASLILTSVHRGVLECLIAGALLTASLCGVAKCEWVGGCRLITPYKNWTPLLVP